MRKKPKMKKTKIFKLNGFIKPNGTFIALDPLEHENFLITLGINTDNWIKVSSSIGGLYIYPMTDWNARLQRPFKATQAQIDTLFSWAQETGNIEEYNKFIKDYCNEKI
jgi:hypothetical protein